MYTNEKTDGTVQSKDGTAIAFDRAGAGPPIILVDGAMCYRGAGPTWPLAAELIADFTVYTYDRRGRAASTDTQPWAIERELDDLEALITEAGGKAYVYGISSGAVLALGAALRGAPITKLVLFEPPLPADPLLNPVRELPSILDEMVRAGRRGEAVERFQTAVGIPAEMIAGMRNSPYRPALEAIAHTLVYDTTIAGSIPPAQLSSVGIATLVVDSGASTPWLRETTQALVEHLPDAQHLSLFGHFHDVDPKLLAPAIREFLVG
ncbi:alpha/beta hydrolase [Rhizocola hellebori]|uniref:Alpha/beta hydrolase n=1 Tax=Rhizocola hellebori TaxID=1392758 RepID=A0A8J3QJN8_9ACTN|nr:alpha/beta hydrolase [Rhizocola hellebori]GIH11297.1 alpha/beta hydrolase [Rhizocola hellebori]